MEDLRYFHSTVAKPESQQGRCYFYANLIKNQNALLSKEGIGIIRAKSQMPKEGIEPSFPEGTRF